MEEDKVARSSNESVGVPTAAAVPEGFEFRFIYEGVLLTCVTMFGLVSNVIAVVVLLRYARMKLFPPIVWRYSTFQISLFMLRYLPFP